MASCTPNKKIIQSITIHIAYCETCADYITRELFEDILDGEEEHVDWLETQIDLIAKVGLQNYLQSQM